MGDRTIGILLGILLGIVVILLFLFLGSQSTIDAPSLSGGATKTTKIQTQPAAPPGKVSKLGPHD